MFSDLPDYYQTFHRNYDPSIGRFTGVDPIPESAESMSTYQYAFNNPVMFNDPMGDNIPRVYEGILDFVVNLSGGPGRDDYGAKVAAAFFAAAEARELAALNGNSDPNSITDRHEIEKFMDAFTGGTRISVNGNGEIIYGEGPGDRQLTHAQELAKYGQIVAVFNVSGGAQVIGGVAAEYGVIVTDKGYNQNYRTIYPTVYGLGASVGGNFGVIVGRNDYKPTFSDWEGYAYNGVSGSFEIFNGSWGHTSSYNVFTFGVGLGLNYKDNRFNGTYSPGSYTTLMGDPYLVPKKNNDFTGRYIHSYGQH
jgi:hypothetical protein